MRHRRLKGWGLMAVFDPYSAGIDFRIWRLKSIPAL